MKFPNSKNKEKSLNASIVGEKKKQKPTEKQDSV